MNIFLTDTTYRSICTKWVKTIIQLSESQINIWPPLSNCSVIARKFSKDKNLQSELFANAPFTFILVDFNQSENISYEYFEEKCKITLGINEVTFSFDQYLSLHEKQLFGICLMGLDKALGQMQTDTLKEIGSLLEKHAHLSMILLTESNFSEAPFFQDLIAKSILIGNLMYQPLFSLDDSLTFLSGLEQQWKIKLPDGYKNIFAENIGGHCFLLEEAVRIYRDNPSFGFKDVFASHTLITKAKAIFNELSLSDQGTIFEILVQRNFPSTISEYLKKTELVKDGKVGLQYWHYMQQNLSKNKNPFIKETNYKKFQLTYTEERVLDYLESKNDITSREEIAKVLWDKENSKEAFSDWAIDQAIHRLREKLLSSQLGYEIKTVKGKGFILSSTEKLHKIST